MSGALHVACLDLEGVLVPEIWINVAERTGIPELRRTTLFEPDYAVLMRFRLGILDERGIKLPDIERVIAEFGHEGFVHGWLAAHELLWAADLIPNLTNLESS